MSVPYFFVDLEQGSSEWHAWRRLGIGASEAPALLSESPWKTRAELLSEKCAPSRPPRTSPAMAFGTATEPEARAAYERSLGLAVLPVCVQSTERDWLRASLDGLSADGQRVVEIKCGRSAHAYTTRRGRPPRYYMGQLQHILAVTGLDAIDFWCYLPGEPSVHLRVGRDEAYINRLLAEEQSFWSEVLENRARLDRAAD